MTAMGLKRLQARRLLFQQILLPFYWLMIGIATIRAARDLLIRPFYWFKSPHQPAASTARVLRRNARSALAARWLGGS